MVETITIRLYEQTHCRAKRHKKTLFSLYFAFGFSFSFVGCLLRNSHNDTFIVLCSISFVWWKVVQMRGIVTCDHKKTQHTHTPMCTLNKRIHVEWLSWGSRSIWLMAPSNNFIELIMRTACVCVFVCLWIVRKHKDNWILLHQTDRVGLFMKLSQCLCINETGPREQVWERHTRKERDWKWTHNTISDNVDTVPLSTIFQHLRCLRSFEILYCVICLRSPSLFPAFSISAHVSFVFAFFFAFICFCIILLSYSFPFISHLFLHLDFRTHQLLHNKRAYSREINLIEDVEWADNPKIHLEM